MTLVMGIDLGLTVAKAGIVGLDGSTEVVYREEYDPSRSGAPGEADAEAFWQAIVRVIRGALSAWGGEPARIRALAVSSHAETLLFLDRSGRPSRPGILWSDTRAEEESVALLARFGAERLLEITGQTELAPIYPAPKLAWLLRHEPGILERTAAVLLPGEYITARLCGTTAPVDSLWSSSFLLDIRSHDWHPDLLAFTGIGPGVMPRPVGAGVPLGTVTAAAAAATRLPTTAVVVSGGLDQACAALGVGNVEPGTVTESSGSVLAMLATTEQPVCDRASRIPCFIHVAPRRYCLLPWCPTAGTVLKWFRDTLGSAEVARAGQLGVSAYEVICEQAGVVPAGSDGLLMIPHFDGEYFPDACPEMRGVLAGLRLGHGKGHLARALLEGVAYVTRQFVEMLVAAGADVDRVLCLGGGSRSPLWSGIKADVCGIPMITVTCEEAAVQGAAIVAAIGAGLYPNLHAARAMVAPPAHTYLPRPENRDVYEEGYRRYLALSDRVRTFFRLPSATRPEGRG